MPGKVNPVIPELVSQICYQIIGYDVTISMASEASELELNMAEPIIAYDLLHGLMILKNACITLTARCITGTIDNVLTIRSGIEYMIYLAAWYRQVSQDTSVGFFQIGGGIAGDFSICVVPMLNQDVVSTPVPEWGYFCQISDSTTSFGSYSGAVPNEKITWGKLSVDTPRFIIESDATIVAPLIFAKVLGW